MECKTPEELPTYPGWRLLRRDEVIAEGDSGWALPAEARDGTDSSEPGMPGWSAYGDIIGKTVAAYEDERGRRFAFWRRDTMPAAEPTETAPSPSSIPASTTPASPPPSSPHDPARLLALSTLARILCLDELGKVDLADARYALRILAPDETDEVLGTDDHA